MVGRASASLGYFAAIGLGFLVLEVVLIQRFVLFLGFPTYALSVVLFALLVFTGAGSLLSNRAGRDPRRALMGGLSVAVALIALAALGLQPLLRALIDLPFALRIACTVALLAPLGVVLGMAMPLGLRRLERLYPDGVAWAWGINGIASVLASVLAITVAITLGYTAATLLALACYLAALAHAAFGRWPAAHPRSSRASRPASGRRWAEAPVSPARRDVVRIGVLQGIDIRARAAASRARRAPSRCRSRTTRARSASAIR